MRLSWPILGIGKVPGIFISQWFGENVWLYGVGGHPGIDIAAPQGTQIIAAHDGQIIKATDNYIVGGKNFGIYYEQMWVEEGHVWQAIYGHNSIQPYGEISPSSENKPQVSEGEPMGKVGHTGFVISSGGLGDHLHFGLYKDGVAVDPIPYMKIQIHFVGWTDKEKGLYIPADSMDRLKQIINAIPALKDDYQLDKTEWNLGRRPWPNLHE